MKISTTLQKAQALISDPARWTKGWLARNKAGANVDPCSPSAVCFCAFGAVERVAGDFGDAQNYLASLTLGASEWNDKGTHLEVMLGFDFAILMARDEGK